MFRTEAFFKFETKLSNNVRYFCADKFAQSSNGYEQITFSLLNAPKELTTYLAK